MNTATRVGDLGYTFMYLRSTEGVLRTWWTRGTVTNYS